MNISTKSILASTLLVALFAGTSANAEGRAGGSSDYDVKSTPAVDFKKVSVKSPAPTPIHIDVNR